MGWVGSEPRPEDLGIWQMQEGRIFQKEGTALEGMNSWLGFMVNGVRETLRGWCLGFEARRLGGGEDGGAVKPGGRRLRGEGGLDFIPSSTGQRWREGQRQNHAWLSGSLAAEWRADWGGHAGRRGHTRPGESGQGLEEGPRQVMEQRRSSEGRVGLATLGGLEQGAACVSGSPPCSVPEIWLLLLLSC